MPSGTMATLVTLFYEIWRIKNEHPFNVDGVEIALKGYENDPNLSHHIFQMKTELAYFYIYNIISFIMVVNRA